MTACFDIGASFMRYGLPDGTGLVPENGRVETPKHDLEAFMVALQAGLVVMKAPESSPVSISLCGTVDPQSGVVTVANVPAINGLPLAHLLAERLKRPVFVTNDADCFALAEAFHGAGAQHRNVFAAILGTGVGGGLVIDKKLVQGAGGVTGEWGHGSIVDPGFGGLVDPLPRTTCGCGRIDCVDPVGSARGLEHLHQMLTGDQVSSKSIVLRFSRGDATAARTVELYVENLARVLGIIVNVTGVTILPVGGGLGTAPVLLAALDKRLRELTLADFDRALVVPGRHAADGGLIGAALSGQPAKEMAA